MRAGGFHALQCGLGAWHLALLHLVAHSLYKAHAFLSAGSAVDGWRLRELMGPRRRPSTLLFGAATVTALAGAAAGVILLERFGPSPPSTDVSQWVLAIIVALAVVPMVGHATAGGALSMAVRAASAAGVAALFVAWHTAAGHLWPVAESPSASTRLGWVLVGAGFVALFAVKAALTLHPEGPLARQLHPWLFAGLYLDERFTRLTFRIWPPPLQTSAAASAVRVPSALEART